MTRATITITAQEADAQEKVCMSRRLSVMRYTLRSVWDRERVRRATTMTGQAIPFRDSHPLLGFQPSRTRFIGAPSLPLRVRGLRLDPQMPGILRQPALD